jgi:hypothetical protein
MKFVISEIADNTAIKLYKEGCKVDYITRKLNIGVGTLYKIIDGNGIPRRRSYSPRITLRPLGKCSYCGADILSQTAKYCSECGKYIMTKQQLARKGLAEIKSLIVFFPNSKHEAFEKNIDFIAEYINEKEK